MNKTTTQDVREAMVNCFYEAHCADTEINENEKISRQYCLSLVKKFFIDNGVDYDNPTKGGILKVVEALAEFSKNFRSQDIIEKHKKEIFSLLSKI
jgi:hypothetical protein